MHPSEGPDPRLRLTLITDGVGDPARIAAAVEAALDGGLGCVQLREPRWSARILERECERLLPLCRARDALLLVNDRIDVAAAGLCDGVQIGHRSLRPAAARRALGPSRLLGFSAHDEEELARAAGVCDFALLSPVWPTTSKPGAAFLGPERAGRLTAAAPLPVAWLGGVDAASVRSLGDLPAAERPFGVAVRSAIMAADDPGVAVRALLAAWPVA